MSARQNQRLLEAALVASEPFELASGQVMILRPFTDDVGSIQFGTATHGWDVKFFLGSASNYILFDRGTRTVTLEGVPLTINNAAGTWENVTNAINNSSVTYANSNLVVLGSATLQVRDSAPLRLGDDVDVRLRWNDTAQYLEGGKDTGFTFQMPSGADAQNATKKIEIFEDFLGGSVSQRENLNTTSDGATGTNAFRTDVAGGVLNIVTAAVDNDYHGFSSGFVFDFLSAKAFWLIARFRLAEATVNESAWWFGVTSDLTTGGFQSDAVGPLGTYDGVMIWKDEATMAIDFESSNDVTQNTQTNIATFVSNTWTTVAIKVDATATTAVVTAYYSVDGTGTLTAHANTVSLTRAGLVPMALAFGVKAGPTAAAETLQVDYVRALQIR